MMRALVHIGPYKTGSTSIQMALRKNLTKLAQAGAHLPQVDVNTLAVPFLPDRMLAELRLPKGVATRADYVPHAEQTWAALKDELVASPARLCILSSEHFSAPGMNLPKFFAHLNDLFEEVTVLGYVRHPVDHYVSSLQQKVKAGHPLKRIRPSQYRYGISRALHGYLDHLPATSIIARNFARDNLVGGDAVKDFCAVLGRFGVDVDLPSENANESLPGVAVAWLLSVNEAFEKAKLGEDRHALVHSLIRSPVLGSLPKLKITDPLLRGYLIAGAREECDWINQTFLTDQKQIDLSEAAGAQVGDAAANARLSTWLTDYMVPEAMHKLLAEIERHHTSAANLGKLPKRRLKGPDKVT
jgi:hypothetical protein